MKKQIKLLLVLIVGLTCFSARAQQAYYEVSSGNGKGLRFWGNVDHYKIHMGTGSEYQYGPVTDYSIKSNMTATPVGRGWTWGQNGQTPIAALNAQGNMQIAGNFITMGSLGIGTSSADTKLHINTSSAGSALTFQASSVTAREFSMGISSTASFFIKDVYDNVDRFKISGNGKTYISHAGDASVSSDGALTFGSVNGLNLTLDNNEIMARNNGSNSNLNLNIEGGMTAVGGGLTVTAGDLKVNTGKADFRGLVYSRAAPTHSMETEQYRIGRADNDIRYHSIYSNHGGNAVLNYLQFRIHNGGSGLGHTEQAVVMTMNGDGNVGIGTTDTFGYRLAVNGTIGSKEVKVEVSSSWPDYVFAKNYNLKSLEETETYIQDNKHLPEIPSAQEVEADGILLGEMNAKLLQKIEELTLHLIDQNKKNEVQNEQIQALTKRLNDLEGK